MSADGDDKKGCSGGDFISLGPVISENGLRPCVYHHEDHSFDTGFIKPVKEGESLSKESVFLRQRGERNEFDVEPVFSESTPTASGKGPARVTSNAFRSGWDNIFGSKAPAGQA